MLGDDSIVVRLLFGEDHSNNRNQKNPPQQSHPAPTSHSSVNSSTTNHLNVQQTSVSTPSDYWSMKFPREGEVPKLKWSFQSEIRQNIPPGDSKVNIAVIFFFLILIYIHVCIFMYVYRRRLLEVLTPHRRSWPA